MISRLRRSACLFALCCLYASCSAARAHDLWITFAGPAGARRAIVNYGHPHDRPPTVADKILDLFAVAGDERISLLAGIAPANSEGAPVVETRPFADNGRMLVAARYDNGYWAKLADGSYRNVSRRLVHDAADAVWSGKFAKALTGAEAPWNTVLGHELEIVPLSDPKTLKVGDLLEVRVLFHGKPLAGGEVERGDGMTSVPDNDIPRFNTGADGVAAIPVVKNGPHLLVIDHRVSPSATPELATADLYNATLWFAIGEALEK